VSTPAGTPSFKDLSRAFFSELGRRLVDPIVMSSLFAGLFVVMGFAAIALSWRGAAATLVVGIQMAYVTSGALAGLGLIAMGLGMLHIQGSRVLEARERAELDNFVKETRRLLATVHSLRSKGYDRRRITSLVRAKPKKLAPINNNNGKNQTAG